MAGVPILRRRSPGIIRYEPLRDERGRRQRKWLRRGGFLSFRVALRNGAFLDPEDWRPGVPIQYVEVSGLVAGNHDRQLIPVAAQCSQHGLGSSVVVPQIVMHELETPDYSAGLCR